MPVNDYRKWVRFTPFDPLQGTVVREPVGEGKGYWVGAPGVTFCEQQGQFYLTYRIRRPRGVHPDRGGEIRIASSHDGISFEDVWTGTKDQLDTASIERSALLQRPDGNWRLYISYVDPSDGRWMVSMTEAEDPGRFDLRAVKTMLTAASTGTEGVKDPFIFNIAGLYHMILSVATTDSGLPAEDLHGTHDAYNTGLIKSATGLATSSDGENWNWEGEIFGPSGNCWDKYAARIGTLWYCEPVWLAFYDGSADVSENYEERCGLAFSHDLRTFHRVTRNGPLFNVPHGTGAIRYFDVIARPDATFYYYELARPDGSHEMRVYRTAAEA